MQNVNLWVVINIDVHDCCYHMLLLLLIIIGMMLYDSIPCLNCCMLLMCMHEHFGNGSFPLCGIELAGPINLPNGQR